jgi:hypothetical protein
MAKTQAQTMSRGHRLLGWVRRHKVSSVFLGLLLILVLYLGASWVVMELQIRSERERFNAAASKVEQLANLIKTDESKVETVRYCTHSNFGGIFEKDSIGCDAAAQITDINMQMISIQTLVAKVRNTANSLGLVISSGKSNDARSVASYDFIYQDINCYVDVLSVSSKGNQQEESLAVYIDCGGKAQQDYFPVTHG